MQLLDNIYDLIRGIVESGFLTSKKTWTAILTGVAFVIASLSEVQLSEATQVATVAYVVLILTSIAIQDYVLGKVDWSELEDDLAKLFLKREVIAGLLGVIALWVYDLTGYEVTGDLIEAILVIWGVLIAGQSVQSIGKVQDAKREIENGGETLGGLPR